MIYENRYTELGENENETAEVKRFEVRLSVGGFGIEREAVVEMIADLSDKVIEMALENNETEFEESAEKIDVESIHDKFEAAQKEVV